MKLTKKIVQLEDGEVGIQFEPEELKKLGWEEVEDFVDRSAKEIIMDIDREFADKKAEKFICEWTSAESLEEMKRDTWSTSDVHSILMDFILSQKSK